MRRYRTVVDYGCSGQAQAMALGYQGQTQGQMLAAMNQSGPTTRFVEDANGAWVQWREAQLALQHQESKLMRLMQSIRALCDEWRDNGEVQIALVEALLETRNER